jgi:hypothetical protein
MPRSCSLVTANSEPGAAGTTAARLRRRLASPSPEGFFAGGSKEVQKRKRELTADNQEHKQVTQYIPPQMVEDVSIALA